MRGRFLEEGLDCFEDHQVLELLLFQVVPRGDTNPIAHRLMDRFGSLSAVLEADPTDLASVQGVGSRAAAFLSLIPQVTRRYFQDRVKRDNPQLTSSVAVIDYVLPLMTGRPEEVFYVLCLDSHCRVLYPALISEGTVKEAHVNPRQVVEQAIRHRAASVVLAHNHPGGAAKPSTPDHRLTALIVQLLGGMGIPVLDHVIVANDQAYSFAKEGVLPKYTE
ncbi:MAG: DNA repair protein RadC [Chromatiaceae bacterium]|nr:DNA repair protein RadC [Chromatiaceae bacterium]